MIKIHQTIGRIAGKVSDYVICNNCNRINWYENERCIECNQGFITIERGTHNQIFGCNSMEKEDGEKLLKEYDKDGLDVDSCELDV